MKPRERLARISGFSIDDVAAAAGTDPEILRLENLDTDLRPPRAAIEATREALERDDANSYLPFTGTEPLRRAVAARLEQMTGFAYNATNVVITCGGTEGLFDALLATTDPGDEVVLTDPTYAGMIERVRLAGALPRLVPWVRTDGGWRLDLDALRESITVRTRALFLMSPSMPSGAVLERSDWEVAAEVCRAHDLWLLYNASMERILFRGREPFHPASLSGMAERTLTIGSVSKEYRMIGWRVGWVAGPASIMSDVARVHIYNAVTPSGISQAGALAALTTTDDGLRESVLEWERRHDVVVDELRDLFVMPAEGGWSLLLDVSRLGHTSAEASRRLLSRGKVAATPITNWSERYGGSLVRLVFSNEPASRLRGLRVRVMAALG